MNLSCHPSLFSGSPSPWRLFHNVDENHNCHSDPERSEGEESLPLARGKLREESKSSMLYKSEILRLAPQNDITAQSLRERENSAY
jgi:hypothetical protein